MERKTKICGVCNLPKVMWKARTRDHPAMCKECYNKPKVGDTFKEKKVSYDPIGVPYHKEVRIVDVKPSKPKEDKSISELLKLATIVFNKWIRKRDAHGMTFTCISCGNEMISSYAQCGHYMPSTYSSLRFHEYNCNSECETCNCNDPNHLIGYRKNLIAKIGLKSVEWLESHKIANTHKWDKQELLEIISKYK